MNDTFTALEQRMYDLKFMFVPAGSGSDVVGSFFRPVETARDLSASDQRNYFEVEVWDRYRITRIEASDRYSFEAKLTGMFMPERWCKLAAYSIPPEEFFKHHRAIETALVRAWEAMKP